MSAARQPAQPADTATTFAAQGESILGRIHARLGEWRSGRADAALLAALGDEFGALRDAAVAAARDDIAALSGNVATLLARDGKAAGTDGIALLNLLEETHDGLAADLGLTASAAGNHARLLNGMVEALLSGGDDGGDDAAPPVATDPTPTDGFNPGETPLLNAPRCAFNDYLPRLRALAAEAAGRHRKPVELSLIGGEVAVDRQLPERLLAAFAELIDNSVAHGIESADARAAAGKPASGQLTLSAAQRRGELTVEYADDGGGLDADAIAARALQLRLATRAEEVGEQHYLQILAHDGGLRRVVRAALDLGGLLALQSARGGGVRWQFQLPLPQVTQRALMVTVGRHRFALLARAVERLLRARAEQIVTHRGRRAVEVDGRRIPLVDLAVELGEPSGREVNACLLPAAVSLVLLRLADRIAAFQVDEYHDVIQVICKPPDAQLATVRGLAGVAVLPDSGVAMILDPAAFIARARLESDALSAFAGDAR